MQKAVIIEPETWRRNDLRKHLEIFCPELRVVGESPNLALGRKLILERRPDLVFLDIQMENGGCIDLLNSFPDVSFSVIFMCNHDESVVRSLKLSDVDFLVRPINAENLVNVIRKQRINI